MPRSLALRLIGLSASWVALALGLAAAVLMALFSAHVEQTVQADMSAALNRLAAIITPQADPPVVASALPDPLYATPLSGRYWQLEALDTSTITRSRSLWDFVLDTPGQAASQGERLYRLAGPDRQQLTVLSRVMEVETGAGALRPYLITIAEDAALLDSAKAGFAREMLATLAVLGLAVAMAAWVQIKLGLKPLDRIRSAVEAVRHGRTERLAGEFPEELTPLVQEVNDLLQARETSTAYARSRASDLAHGLKTPLAALTGVADRLRQRGCATEAQDIEQMVVEMSERVEYQLRLATLRVRSNAQTASASLNTAILRTLSVLKKTSHGESLGWVAALGPDLTIDMERQDLMELVGILMENAAKWAGTTVTISTERENGLARLTIRDDGPGIPQHMLALLGEPSRRLDESRPGTGFGLSIAKEIVRLNDGVITFTGQDGGLSVGVLLRLSDGHASPAGADRSG